MLVDVLLVLDELVLELLFQVDALVAGLRQAVDGIHDEVEAVQIVQHRHVEGRGDGAFFLVATDVDVVVVGAAVSQPVDGHGYAWKAKMTGLSLVKSPFDHDRIISECLSCRFNDVNCWRVDALHKLAFGLEEMSKALEHVLQGARFTAVDIQRMELGGPQAVVLLDWGTTDFPDDTVPAYQALRHFHVVGRDYGPYHSIEDYLADTGLKRFVVYEWIAGGVRGCPREGSRK